jgi:hypothetical protein
VDDLVWIRDRKGIYFLTKIVGSWSYDDSAAARAHDMAGIYPVEFVKVGKVENVPGKVRAAFRAPNTFQRIADATAENYSQLLYSELSGQSPIAYSKIESKDFFSLLSDRDIEDLVLIYLQLQGWILIPSTRDKDTQHTEFRLVHARTAIKADVQVKSGLTRLSAGNYKDEENVFLFASSGEYGDSIPANVTIISREDLLGLIDSRPELLPQSIQFWRTRYSNGPQIGTAADAD